MVDLNEGLTVLKYDINDRPVYRNEDVPHEEDRNVYCPNPCKFKDSCWNAPCIERPELTEIKAVGQICFNRLDKKELTCEQVENSFNKHTPSHIITESSAIDDNGVQVVWKDSACPVQFIRDAIGNDLSSIRNVSFDTTGVELNYAFYFECYDDKKAEIIKSKYLQILQNYFGENVQTVLKVVNNDKIISLFRANYTYFYFEFEDIDCYNGVIDFCKELNLEIAFNKVKV